jgi:phytoene dehydrogenase-like protein
LSDYDLLLCDLTPRQLLKVGGQRLSDSYKRRLGRYRYGAGAFKVDYALSAPIPWKATSCLRAATVHLGGSFEEIAASEKAVRTDSTPIVPSFCWPSPVSSILAGSCGQTYGLGLLSCAEWIQSKHA